MRPQNISPVFILWIIAQKKKTTSAGAAGLKSELIRNKLQGCLNGTGEMTPSDKHRNYILASGPCIHGCKSQSLGVEDTDVLSLPSLVPPLMPLEVCQNPPFFSASFVGCFVQKSSNILCLRLIAGLCNHLSMPHWSSISVTGGDLSISPGLFLFSFLNWFWIVSWSRVLKVWPRLLPRL